MLNRLLFRASRPEERYRVLQKFYLMPEKILSRFYRGGLTRLDRMKIFTGTPPVPIVKALQCVFEKEKVA